jgi:hypothetical protein
LIKRQKNNEQLDAGAEVTALRSKRLKKKTGANVRRSSTRPALAPTGRRIKESLVFTALIPE